MNTCRCEKKQSSLGCPDIGFNAVTSLYEGFGIEQQLSDTDKTEVKGKLPLLSWACQQKIHTKPVVYLLNFLTGLEGKRYTFAYATE